MQLDEIKSIIEIGNFEYLIGKVENEYFDCKKGIYFLSGDSGKRELAKDVTSFANFNGGYILIGPQTVRNDKHLGDEITAISYLHEDQINIKQHSDIIHEWVYPDIHGLNIFWKPSKSDKEKGVFVICIPNQDEYLKPFLIKKTIDEKKKTEIVFGYAERKSDSSVSKDVTSIHALLRDGINYNKNIDSRFSKIEFLIEGLQRKNALDKKEDVYKYVKKRSMMALAENGMDKLPNFALIAYPERKIELKTIFLSAKSSIKRKLENPPELRYAGWDLATDDRAQIKEGKYIRVRNGERKVIDLYNGGILIFNVLANEDFLSWGRRSDSFKFNTLALIEVVCNFVLFYAEVIKDFNGTAHTVVFCYGFNNLWTENNKYFLTPYAVGSHGYLFNREKKDAPNSSFFSDQIIFELSSFSNIGQIVYGIVENIYLWFGIEADKIPYTKQLNGTTVIDIEQIKTIR